MKSLTAERLIVKNCKMVLDNSYKSHDIYYESETCIESTIVCYAIDNDKKFTFNNSYQFHFTIMTYDKTYKYVTPTYGIVKVDTTCSYYLDLPEGELTMDIYYSNGIITCIDIY